MIYFSPLPVKNLKEYRESLEIHFSGWQAGHGDAKHVGRAGLLLRAPALRGLRPTVSREHRKEPRSERRDISD